MRELALIKVDCDARDSVATCSMWSTCSARTSSTCRRRSLIVQVVADESSLTALVENLRPFGIRELVRTGRVAMMRGPRTTAVNERESAEMERFHHESGRLPRGRPPVREQVAAVPRGVGSER